MEVSKHAPGTFCWIELGTTDQAAAKKFYHELFGWSSNDVPMGPDSTYTMLQLNGKDVAALYQLDANMCAHGIPPHWQSYVSVENVEATAKAITAAGGRLMMEPFDVGEHGRMTVAQDPTGAHFAVWQPRQHIGISVLQENNALCWQELATSDTAMAKDFYTKVFRWNAQTRDDVGIAYTEFYLGVPGQSQPAGGMMQLTSEWAGIPPHWMIYFAVADCDATAEKATALGAKVLVPPSDIPNVGRFAVVSDQQGAHFSIIKMNQPA
jgi:uncharacterized protein